MLSSKRWIEIGIIAKGKRYGGISAHSDNEIRERYEHQIKQDIPNNMGGLVYSAFQVGKNAWI